MTRLTHLLIFILSLNLCFGQTDTVPSKKNKWGVNIGSLYSAGSLGYNVYAYCTLEKGKNFVGLGPAIGQTLTISDSYYYAGTVVSNKMGLNGAHFFYQFNPNPRVRRFNFYFQYDFILLYYRDKGVNSVYRDVGIYEDVAYKAHWLVWENYIGYGFKVNFLKHFYLNQSVGIGVVCTSSLIKYEGEVGDKDEGFKGSAIVKLGIGYKFY